MSRDYQSLLAANFQNGEKTACETLDALLGEGAAEKIANAMTDRMKAMGSKAKEMGANAYAKGKSMGSAAYGKAQGAGKRVVDYHRGAVEDVKSFRNARSKDSTGADLRSPAQAKDNFMRGLKGVGKLGLSAGLAGGAAGGAGYGAYRASKKD